MTINISREAVTEPLVEHKSSILMRSLWAIWNSHIWWRIWMVIRFTVCVMAIWYGVVFAQTMARGDADAVAMAFMVGALIAVALGRWKVVEE